MKARKRKGQADESHLSSVEFHRVGSGGMQLLPTGRHRAKLECPVWCEAGGQLVELAVVAQLTIFGQHSAYSSSAMSKIVATWRFGTTSACPGVTGKVSKNARASALSARISRSGEQKMQSVWCIGCSMLLKR